MVESRRQSTRLGTNSLNFLVSRPRQILQGFTNGREVWALADQAVVSATNFLTNVMVARSLGLSNYGVYALGWMALLFFTAMQMALIIAPMMSLGPKIPPEDRPSYFGSAITQELSVVLASTALLVIGLHGVVRFSNQPTLLALALPLSGALVAYMLQDFIRRYLFITRQSRRAFINDAVSCLPQLPLIYFLLNRHQIGVAGVLWITAITSAVGIALGAYWFEPVTFHIHKLRVYSERHWKISRWLAPSSLLSWTSTNFIGLLAPVYYGAEAAGALRAAQNLVAIAHIWFLGLDNVMPAETARRLHAEGLQSASKYLRGMTLRWGGLTAAFVLILSIAPPFWLHLLYGAQFKDNTLILPMYGILYLITFLGRPITAGLQALEYTAPILWAYIATTLMALLIGPALASRDGLLGVMLGSILVQLMFQAILSGSYFHRLRVMNPHTGSL